MSVYTIFTVLGGIALFLFGMQMMSEGLEKAAGTKMRQILEMFTKNRFIGVVVGFVITGVIQSSSATTAMVVSFVNAGLMSLQQSVGVIFGANIGTTVTGQLMAFKFENFAPIIVAVSLVCYMFVKSPIVKKIGYIILGFGILFLGMGMMKDAMSAMADSPVIYDTLQSITNPILLILLGVVITAIIQSSSAMVGILISMAATGLMPVTSCFFVIIGSDIGATVTAMIASINANREAKRAACIHLFFNIIGAIVITILLTVIRQPIVDFIYMISPGGSEAEIASRAIAMANTMFRLFYVVIMFPFAKGLVQLTKIVIPVKPEESMDAEESKLQYIGDKALVTATSALAAMSKEIGRAAELAKMNLDRAMDALLCKNDKVIAQIEKTEDNIDILCREMQDYMVKVTQMQIPLKEEHKIGGFFHVIIDIERIADHAQNIAEVAEKVIKEKIEFSAVAQREMREMYELVEVNLDAALKVFEESEHSLIPEIIDREEEIDKMEKELQMEHIERISKFECSPRAGVFSDVLSNLERIGDHADNIAIAIVPDSVLMELTGKDRIDL